MTPPVMNDLDWRVLNSEPTGCFGVFDVHRQLAEHVPSSTLRSFSIIRCPDWVNVIALTEGNEVVFVRQFRAGVGRVTLELPGGVINPGEAPALAARRELLEETGFAAPAWHSLGSVEPNPALQGNRAHMLLALNARRQQPPTPDEDEVLEVAVHPLAAVPQLIRAGAITHSLVISAFYLCSISDQLRSIGEPSR